MKILFLALWLQMSAQPQIAPPINWYDLRAKVCGIDDAKCVAADETDRKPGAHIYSVEELEAQGWKKSEISVCKYEVFADKRVELDGPDCPTSVVREAIHPTNNPVKTDIQYNQFDLAAQRAADETDGKRNPRDIGPLPNYKLKVCPTGKMCKAPTPVDVPAVQETDNFRERCKARLFPQYKYPEELRRCDEEYPDHHPTCTDKSRVLLTSEDGKKHCIKF